MSVARNPQPSVATGAVLIIAAFACVAIMSAFGKGANAVATGTLVFFQSFISLLLFAPWALRGGFGELRTSRLVLHILRAAAGLLSQALMFVAVKKLPLMNVVLLANSAPLFIPLVTWVWLTQRIGGMVWLGVFTGFAGVVLILRPSIALLKNPYAIIAISAALFSAFALVSVNQLSKTEPPRRILFYYFLFSSLAAAPFAIADWQVPAPKEWLYLGGIGVMMALSQMLIILAYQRATASRIAPFNYTVVIFSGLIGWMVWDDIPGLLSLAGVLLVTAGGVLSTRFSRPDSLGHLGWLGYRSHLTARQEAA